MIFKIEKNFISNVNCLTAMNKFVSDNLDRAKVDRKLKSKYQIVIESIVQKLIDADAKNEVFTIKIKSTLNKTHVQISAKGPLIEENIKDMIISDYFPDELLENGDLKDFALSAIGLDVTTKYKDGINTFKISNTKSQSSKLRKTLTFMLLGALFGLLVRFLVPYAASEIIAKDVLSLVYDLFLNAIKLCLTPMIFLSICTSIAAYSNLSEIKKVALSTIKVFVTFTLLTLIIGFTAWFMFPIEDSTLQQNYTEIAGDIQFSSTAEEIPDIIADTIRLMVPTNIITPFAESIITQTIFLGVIVGIAILLLGEKGTRIAHVLKKLETLVNKIISIIISFLPIAVFCSLASTCITLEAESFITILKWIAMVIACMGVLLVIYFVGIVLFSDIKLKDFIKHFMPVSIVSFTLASSGATLPQAIKVSVEKLKIPRKIASFSMPLGSTINLNGTIMNVTITSLFLITLSGVEMDPLFIGILFFNMFVLAMGTPAIPGGGIVLISTVVAAVGIPTDVVNLIVGVYPITDMIQSGINSTATGAATAIATKSILKKENKSNK